MIQIKTTQAEKKGRTVVANGTKLPAIITYKKLGGVLGERAQQSLRIPSNMWV